MTDPADATPGQRAVAALAAYVADAELTSEPGARDGEVVVTIPGERKLKTVASFLIRDELTSVSAFVIRNPDENHAEFYRFLLRRVMRRPLLGYAVDGSGDVYVRGQVPTVALDGRYLDLLVGALLEAADEPFNDLLAIGFLTSMKREWAWRVARGESLANLEAFRSILAGSEDDPLYAVGPLPVDPATPDDRADSR
ncbi:MAG: YbjN domain-containing protein [Actinomycetales bacterium]|uniref:YbjN domain-containing protein n=1 Tax=Candidatus Phosphoribacter hodrii TaxID=2953743 RepID=A0A934X6V9_9MICO|nr:YbjN domain-containing protein [Candidatus Phosphoribacter hodrii]